MKNHKHNVLMCFDGEYPEKYEKFVEFRKTYHKSVLIFWAKSLPFVINVANILVALNRSPILYLYGVLVWSVLVGVFCEITVARRRKTMLG